MTGAGGSIGSELCRQIDRYDPDELIMLDRDESALHAVQLSLSGRALLDSDDVVLADIRDRDALMRIFEQRRPHVVFHAAALKHLPMLEQYPAEAVKTNVMGTVNVLDAADACGVASFVNVSTDKAANPSSVLGYSKRVAERLTSGHSRTCAGSYLSVRFGNVLGSRGSVLTTFARQIADGGPVTVTDPDVTRFFMTIEEACQLVVQAAAIGSAGEALVLDMGEPVSILGVARQLIERSGRPMDIEFTGLRAGEKLHEELFADGEPQDHRPRHALVSHVPVPPLFIRDIVSLAAERQPAEVTRGLASLCLDWGGGSARARAFPESAGGRLRLPVRRYPALHVGRRRTVTLESAERPWGSWHTIDDGQGYKVKRIHVWPGQRLSYQTHRHRSEHWVVIFGVATCVVGGETIVAGPGGSIDVAAGEAHRIANQHAEELIIIEVQQGAYTGEDDIRRLDDDYGRAGDGPTPIGSRADGPATAAG